MPSNLRDRIHGQEEYIADDQGEVTIFYGEIHDFDS